MQNLTNQLRFALIALIFISVAATPFIITKGLFFPFITGKGFFFRIVVELMVGLYLLLALRNPEYRPRFSWVSVGVIALTAAAGLATLFSMDPVKSFWSNFERMEGYVGLLHLVGWFFVTTAVMRTEKLWMRLFQVSVLSSVGMAVYGLLQLSGAITINQGGVRLDGTLGNAIYLAVYMLFNIFITLFLMLKEKSAGKWTLGFYAIAAVLQTVILFYTATRSATLGLIGGLVVTAIGIASFDKEHKQLRKIAIGTLAAIVVLVGGFLAVRDTTFVHESPVLSRFASISFTETTVKSRFMIWDMALQGIKEKPLFGWGQENFNFVFNKYYNPQMYNQEPWFDRTHNSFLDWFIAAGVLGFLAYLSLFILALWAFLRGEGLTTAERSVFIGLIAAYGFHSLFVFDNLISSIYFMLVLAFAFHLTRRTLPGSATYMKALSSGVLAASSFVVVLGTAALIYVVNVPGISASQTLIDAISPTKVVKDATGRTTSAQKDPKENLAAFAEVTSTAVLGHQEAVEQLLQIASRASGLDTVSPETKKAFQELAEKEGARMLEMRKGDTRLELFYGSFLNQAGKREEGLAHLMEALKLSPNKQAIYFEIALGSYLAAGELDQANAILKQAYDLAPEYTEAQIYYAIGLIYGNKKADADALLTKHFGSPIVDDARVLRAYFDTKQNDRVLEIWKLRAQKAPNDIQTKVSLAVAYRQTGDIASALKLLREVAEMAPEYRQALEQAAREMGGQL